ncbi:CHAT domain-containing protein [candidate division KSB1 bacterium]|nr:CHAT domain-containing protein [candidate division KSB1 bacterium]
MRGNGNNDAAIEQFQHLIEAFPDYSKAYKSAAQTYIFAQRQTEGIQFFSALVQANPTNGYAHYALALLYFNLKEYDIALSHIKQCIDFDPNFIEPYGFTGGIPEIFRAQKDLDGALALLKTYLSKYHETPAIYYGLAVTYFRQYDFENAIQCVNKLLEIQPDFIQAYYLYWYIYLNTGAYKSAMENGEIFLERAQKSNDSELITVAIYTIGTIHYFQGDYWEALDLYNQALAHAKTIGLKDFEGLIVNNIAIIYAMLGNRPKALSYFFAALDYSKLAGTSRAEIRTLINIGNIYKEMGNYQEGLRFYQNANTMSQKNNFKYSKLLSICGIAEIAHLQGRYDEAEKAYNASLKIAQEINDPPQEAYVLIQLGRLMQDLHEYKNARIYLQHALQLGTKTRDLQILWEAQAGLGATYEKQGDNLQAITHYTNAIALYDSVRSNFDMESLATSFLDDKYEAYPSVIQLLAAQSNNEAAFSYAEKYKSKILMDIIAKAKLYIEPLLPDSIRAQFRAIQSQIDSIHTQIADTNPNQQQLLALDQKITTLELRKSALFEMIKQNYSEYYNLTTDQVLTVRQIQERIKTPNQAIAEYIVGTEKTSVFIIRNDSFYYHELALGRKALQTLLVNLSPVFQQNANSADQSTLNFLNAQLSNFAVRPAHALYHSIFAPIEAHLNGITDLVIIPDDVLFYLPFEMLITDTTGVESNYDFRHATFLLEKYVISYASAATLLDPRLQRQRESTKCLYAVGNPDFLTTSQRAPDKIAPVSSDFSALPYSETEVKSIARVFRHAENRIHIGKNAEESRIKTEASDYRILHLATHFQVDHQNPLYSKLILSQDKKASDDGFLHTFEIFNLKLNADIAVLSACNSGLGQLSKGEGMIGVSRAFLYAGVPSTLVSLWNVEDEATSIIMTRFYAHIKSGMSKSQALQHAKRDYLAQASAEQRDPFYWAPFILIGDNGPVSIPRRPFSAMVIWIGFILAIGIALYLQHRKNLNSLQP